MSPERREKRTKFMTEEKITACIDFGQKEKLLSWLLSLKFGHEQVILWDEESLIDQYLFPEEETPKLSLEEIKEKVLPVLMKIARRQVFSETAIETLRMPSNFYKALIEAGVCKLEDFSRLNRHIIKQICSSRQKLRTLQDLLLDRDYLWNPDVEY